MKKIKVGILGCGNISDIYLQNCTKIFDVLEVEACADIILERAQQKAKEFNIKKAYTADEMLYDPEIEIVVNLTVPKAHAEICLRALETGKNVYVEKPLAVKREDGLEILNIAKAKGLLVGSAPDTFLGGGLQTCRKLIDDGWIGIPIGATAFMMGHGPERWHADPEFFYKAGGGPMFDMGPYYLTALVSLLGPVKRVTGSTRISFPERKITSEPKYGTKIGVEVPTHIVGVLDFEAGAIATIITSFDVWGSKLPRIEIYGSEGTLSVPDPNTFSGPILIKRQDADEWTEMPMTHGYRENFRGIGVADMAYALSSGREHRANGEMAFHVLDIMQGIHDASREGKHYNTISSCTRPKPLPLNLANGELDL